MRDARQLYVDAPSVYRDVFDDAFVVTLSASVIDDDAMAFNATCATAVDEPAPQVGAPRRVGARSSADAERRASRKRKFRAMTPMRRWCSTCRRRCC